MNNEQSIFKKIKEQLSLRNRYFYWSIFVFLIAILTGINNYYFYSHVDRSSKRDVRQLKIILEEQIQYCKKNGMKVDECNELLELTISNFGKNAYYNDKLTINGEIIPKERELNDKVVKSDINISLLQNNRYEGYEYHSEVIFDKYLYLDSIFRSMTFSIKDIISITYEDGLKEALKSFNTSYWYRSRPVIGFAIFTYLILWLSRKRTYKLEELQEKEDLKIKKEFQEDLKNNIEIKNTSIIQNKITKYDAILNPPINTLKFENLFDDLDTIGTKFRKVTEKIIFRVYEEQIGRRPLRMSLSTAVYELHEKGILSDTAKNYISIVRVYGNISSHYSDSKICKEEAIAIASSLLNVIDEIYEKNLLTNMRI